MAKRNGVIITTPKGVAVWPSLNEPSKYGKYECKLRLPADDPAVQSFKARLEQIRDEHFDAEVKRLKDEKKAAVAAELKKGDVLKVERDNETGAETGFYLLPTSMNAGGIVKNPNSPRFGQHWSQKPDIFDATGKQLQNPPKVWGGSEVKLSVSVEGFTKTDKTVIASVDLKAAQIIKLVTGGGSRDFGSYGFQQEEGDEIEDGAPPAFQNETAGGGEDDDL
jgi:hypothetical protein